MNNTVSCSMIMTALRDKITLFYCLLLPILLFFALNFFFDELHQKHTILSGVTAVTTLFWGMQGIAFQIYSQRSKGVYKLLKITPLPLLSFIISLVFARALVGILLNAAIWAIGVLILNINVSFAAFAATMLFIVIGMICSTSIGFMIGNCFNNEAQISMASNAVQLPMILLSEAFYSLDALPQWLQWVGKLLPFEPYMKLLYGGLDGWDSSMLLHLLLLVLYIVAAIIGAVISFRWDHNMRLLQS